MLENTSQPSDLGPIAASAPYVPPAQSHSWSQACIKALTQPKVKAYEELANDTTLTPRRVFNWIFASTFVSVAIYFIILYQATKADLGPGERMNSGGAFYCGTVLGIVIVGLLSIPVLVAGAKFQQFIARMLGGTGNYRQLVVTHAALSAPLFPFFFLPAAGVVVSEGDYAFLYIITLAAMVYGVVLSIVAMKAVNKLGWGKAVIPPVVWTILTISLSVAYTVARFS